MLAARLYNDEIGRAMYEQPFRYAVRYGYDREDMRTDLGHDLCPIGHQMELPYHTAKIIEVERAEGTIYGSLPDEEVGVLMFVDMIHDAGESTHATIAAAGLKPIGDIPAGLKTEENRDHEAAIRRFLYDRFFSDVDEQIIEQVEAIISHKDDTILHELFEAGHLAQTLETSNYAHFALARENWHRTGEVIDPITEEGSRLSGLLGVARVVYAHVKDDIGKYSHFGYIRQLGEQADLLRQPSHQLFN